MDYLIHAVGLDKSFGPIHAVQKVHLTVPAGEVLGFLGPNGAGKSTTMKLLTGFLEPDAGTIQIGGHSMQDQPTLAKSKIGYLPEGAPAYPDMTPDEYLDFLADVRGLQNLQEAKHRVVEQVHIGSVLYQSVETLSKGFRRRVGLAAALLHDPEVLILDEPTDGLDPNQKHEVRALIRKLGQTKAVVLSTHILEEVEAVCSRAIIINKGRVVFDGTPVELDGKAPTDLQKNRLDHVFRAITTTEITQTGATV